MKPPEISPLQISLDDEMAVVLAESEASEETTDPVTEFIALAKERRIVDKTVIKIYRDHSEEIAVVYLIKPDEPAFLREAQSKLIKTDSNLRYERAQIFEKTPPVRKIVTNVAAAQAIVIEAPSLGITVINRIDYVQDVAPVATAAQQISRRGRR